MTSSTSHTDVNGDGSDAGMNVNVCFWGFNHVLSLTPLALHKCRETSDGEGCDADVSIMVDRVLLIHSPVVPTFSGNSQCLTSPPRLLVGVWHKAPITLASVASFTHFL